MKIYGMLPVMHGACGYVTLDTPSCRNNFIFPDGWVAAARAQGGYSSMSRGFPQDRHLFCFP